MLRFLLFIGFPLLELLVLVELGSRIGVLATLTLVVGTGVAGATMVRRQGRVVWAAIKARLAVGEIPQAEVAHGAMLLVAGALLITPGVISDAVGLLLLVPWIRELVRIRFFRAIRVIIL